MSSYSGGPGDFEDYSAEQKEDREAAELAKRKRLAREDCNAFNAELSQVVELCWTMIQARSPTAIVRSGVDASVIYRCMMNAREALGDGPEKHERAAVRAWCARIVAKLPRYRNYDFDPSSYYFNPDERSF